MTRKEKNPHMSHSWAHLGIGLGGDRLTTLDLWFGWTSLLCGRHPGQMEARKEGEKRRERKEEGKEKCLSPGPKGRDSPWGI